MSLLALPPSESNEVRQLKTKSKSKVAKPTPSSFQKKLSSHVEIFDWYLVPKRRNKWCIHGSVCSRKVVSDESFDLHVRVSSREFRTVLGHPIHLHGKCNREEMVKRYGKQVAKIFRHGIPSDWANCINEANATHEPPTHQTKCDTLGKGEKSPQRRKLKTTQRTKEGKRSPSKINSTKKVTKQTVKHSEVEPKPDKPLLRNDDFGHVDLATNNILAPTCNSGCEKPVAGSEKVTEMPKPAADMKETPASSYVGSRTAKSTPSVGYKEHVQEKENRNPQHAIVPTKKSPLRKTVARKRKEKVKSNTTPKLRKKRSSSNTARKQLELQKEQPIELQKGQPNIETECSPVVPVGSLITNKQSKENEKPAKIEEMNDKYEYFDFRTPIPLQGKLKSHLNNHTASESGSKAWTSEETLQLQTAYYKVPPQMGKRFWKEISKYLPGRDATECCTQWFESLERSVKKRKPSNNALTQVNVCKGKPSQRIYGAGTAKFRKAIRAQWEEHHQGYNDDLHNATPFKSATGDEDGWVDDAALDVKTPKRLDVPLSEGREQSRLKQSEEEEDSTLLAPQDRSNIDGYILFGKKIMNKMQKAKVNAAKEQHSQTRVDEVEKATALLRQHEADTTEAVRDQGVGVMLSPSGAVRFEIDEDRFKEDSSEEEVFSSSDESDIL